ncbi:MAG TPA: LPS export ABC transporter periplasmic protein LptC [Alphaproteobacteria bacterium]|jgi:lipopolysaccharide export system protein LptC|nr:LPS export ABC transporter periplasmic protein LptC [Alphaproteobacteria bacterium]
MSVNNVDAGPMRDPSRERRFRISAERRRAVVNPRYTRFVGAMKLVLPLVALGLVVAVIAWPSLLRQKEGFHLSFSALRSDQAAQLTMVEPRYTGADSAGRPFVVTADQAEQDPEDPRRVTLHQVQADMTMKDGSWFSVSSPAGLYLQGKRTLDLHRPVDLFSDRGYEFHAGTVHLDLAAGTADSDEAVRGQGPFGSLRADSLEAEQRGRVLRFRGNVRLVIQPQRQD